MTPRANDSDAPSAQWEADYEVLYRRNIELTRQVDHLSIIREISLAVNSSLELSETLPIIASVVQGALDVRRATIFALENNGERLQPVAAKYGDDLITADRLEEEYESRRGTSFGRALDTRAVVLEDRGGLRAAYVPLSAKDEAFGVLVLEDRRDGAPFSAADAALYQQLAAPIAMAIYNARLYALAVIDGLTGLYVRRYFDLRLADEFAQSHRYRRSFSILLFDIDHFKKFNDTHGHQTGDAVLRQFAALLQDNTRASDICCRYGGEEMAVILPETGIEDAAVLADKLCVAVRTHAFLGLDEQTTLSVTTSIGVAECSEMFDNPAALVQAADTALYEAKHNGRDRVELATG